MKKITLLLAVIVSIFATTTVVFNNLYQIWNPLIQNQNVRTSFLLILIGVTFYSIVNRNKLKKELI